MKYLYIFDSHQFSSQCGVGTYVKELLKLVSPWEDMVAYRVMFNTQAEKAMACTCKGTDYILMPRTIHGDPFECEDDFLPLFASFIEEEENSIFLYNYIPCEKFLRKTKAHFPKAKHLCVVHDLNWTSHLQGDDKNLRKILATEDSKSFIEAKVKDLYQREKDQFELADWIVCLSEDTLRVLREVYRISDEKITLIPNGFVTRKRRMSKQARSKCRQRYHLGEQEKVFLSVGRIGKAKGVFAFLNAFKEILKKEPDCRWVIAGEVGRAADLLPCA